MWDLREREMSRGLAIKSKVRLQEWQFWWGKEDQEFNFGHVKFRLFTKHLNGAPVGSWNLEFGRERDGATDIYLGVTVIELLSYI